MKKAFTLSEALVTLAIIGVLAAILIPVINNVRPDKDKIVYKKALYSLQNAVSNAMDSAYVSDSSATGTYWGAGTNWGAGANWGSGEGGWGSYESGGANISNYYDWYGSGGGPGSGTGTGSGSGSGSGGGAGSGSGEGAGADNNLFCKTIAESLNTVGTVNCEGPWTGGSSSYTSPNFITSDGIRYWGLEDDASFVGTGSTAYKEIYVDRKVGSSEVGSPTFRNGSGQSGLGLKIRIRKDGKVYTDGGSDYEYENGLVEDSFDITKK